MSVTKSISLEAAHLEFVAVFMPSKNYSQKTREEYGRDTAQLVEYLAGLGIEYADETRFGHLSGFVQGLERAGQKSATRARKVFSIKVFFGYLEAYGYIGRNPADQLVAPTVERFPVRLIPIAEFESKLAALSNPRDRAMLLLLATTQIRQNELVALTLDDVKLSAEIAVGEANAGSIAVSRASGRHHFTIDYRCWLALKEWLIERKKIVEKKTTTERSVFLNRFGRRLTVRGLRFLMYKV